jgi:effector-binding domain-containing protein
MIAFHMPNEMSYETTPKPKDERIKSRAVPAKKMIAIKFSGRSTDSNIYEHEKKLRAYMKKNSLNFKGKPIYAFYNAPFVPWFLRRNEVLFELVE